MGHRQCKLCYNTTVYAPLPRHDKQTGSVCPPHDTTTLTTSTSRRSLCLSLTPIFTLSNIVNTNHHAALGGHPCTVARPASEHGKTQRVPPKRGKQSTSDAEARVAIIVTSIIGLSNIGKLAMIGAILASIFDMRRRWGHNAVRTSGAANATGNVIASIGRVSTATVSFRSRTTTRLPFPQNVPSPHGPNRRLSVVLTPTET